MTRAFIFILTVLAFIAPAMAQQPPTASVGLSKDTVDLGDTLILQVAIDGASTASTRSLPASDSFSSEFLGGRDESSHSIISINGRTQESRIKRYLMQWRITPTRAGRAVVEAFDIDVGGTSVHVPRTEFNVAEPGENTNFQLALEADRTDVYIGEPIHMKLVWTLGGTAKTAAFSGSDGGDMFDLATIDPRPAKSRNAPVQANDPYRVVQFLNGQVVITRSQVTRDGRAVLAFVAELVITPRQAGQLQVGPFRVAFDEVTGQRSRTFFDSPFDDLSTTKRSVVSSNSVALNVQALPTEGKPADFTGLIGQYSIDAVAGNTEANVGDPIPLTVTIRGPEPLDSIKGPALESQPEFADKFKPAPEGWESSPPNSGQRAFSMTIRPRTDTVTEIPAIRLPYFDTKTGKYEVAQSKPIPLKVHASREVTLADAIRPGASSLPIPTAGTAKLTSSLPGIGATTESTDALIDQRISVIGAVKSPVGIAVIALPPLIAAGIGVAAARRRAADPVHMARRAALSEARRCVQQATSPGELLFAVRTGLAPFVGAAPQAVTSTDAARLGDGASAQQLLRELEAAAFDSRSIDITAAKSKAEAVFRELSQ